MLFKMIDLQGIKDGSISLAFRKWKKPTVKKGTLLNTALGQVQIQEVTEIGQGDITEESALKAGYINLEALNKALSGREYNLYQIELSYYGADPRIGLRQETSLSETDFLIVRSKLERMDQLSKQGNWTIKILMAIQDNPKMRAQDLANQTGREKDWLKANIRKLKNLGLTVSHPEGYTIAPRGKAFLKMLE